MGGQNYFKYDIWTNSEYEVKKINVDTTTEELYYDWELMEDKFGFIRNEALHPTPQEYIA